MLRLEIIDKIDKAIAELVYPKKELLKAYNYYKGVRDKDLFKYLEENFGLGNPTSIEFTPLIKKHIDALLGEYLGTPVLPKVQCKDPETIANIGREKLLQIIKGINGLLTKNLKNTILSFVDGKNLTDSLIEKQLNKLIEDIDNSFISDYEIAALNVIEYIMLSKSTNINKVLRNLFMDLLIAGESIYKVELTVEKNNIRIRDLDPRNVFFDYNLDSPYLKDAHRVVVRDWLTKDEILSKYGKDLSAEDRKKIKEHWESTTDSSEYYIHYHGTSGILNGEVVIPGYPEPYLDHGIFTEYISVYEVEWIETDDNFVMQRYKGIRLGEDIYIPIGLDENVIRTKDNPSWCGLSVNGMRFLNRNNRPYSLMLACTTLQDKYDILLFYRDSLIASSGTVGDYVDISLLPTFLGENAPERLKKFIAYKKNGLAVIDTSQPGRLEGNQASYNQFFNGFDDTVKAQSIQAILITIDSIEQTVSSITGVFRERLNGIELRDAVTNIKVGLNNSFIITKLYYNLMDLVVEELLLDSLNQAKIVWKNGLTGTLVLGNKYQKIFTALPEHFTLTDYDIRITTSTDVIKDLEYIKLTVPELAKSGILAPDIILEALTCKSLTELKTKALKSLEKLKEENNQLQQATQLLGEAQQQLKLLQQQLQESLKKIQLLDEAKIQLEQSKMQLEYKVDWYKAQTDRNYKDKMAEEASKRTKIEEAQLADGNPYNDKIRQIGL